MLAEDEKNSIIKDVRNFLTEVEHARCKETKAGISLKMFQLLSSPKGIRFIKDHEKFRDQVMGKLISMRKDFESLQKYKVRFQMVSETIMRRLK